MKEILKSADFQKKLLLINSLVPLVMLILDWYFGKLGANPPEAIIRTTGIMAILFLILSLVVTPLSFYLKWNWTIKHRRWLGLWAFYYAVLHLVAYALFDKSLDLGSIIVDIKKRPFILLGFVGFLLMIPLAMTSTNKMIQKLGPKKWKKLHKLTFIIAFVTSIHFWLIVKSDLFYPGLVAASFLILITLRIFINLQKNKKSLSAHVG
ncbi:MAG: sulfoxide reductase heme-binding subunit YedZ [Bdellovibrionales bacterium]|nr:sulfoxide reductase heme-binding subunit YedZ [Bdellovibrionales bacterium]